MLKDGKIYLANISLKKSRDSYINIRQRERNLPRTERDII